MERADTGRAALLFLALLAGCARYEPRPLSERKILEGLRSLTLDGLARTPAETPEGAGFDPADGLSEPEAVSVGLLANPDLRAVRADRRIAEAQLVAAGLFPDPEVDASWLSRSDGAVVEGALAFWVPLRGERGLRKEKARLKIEEVDAQVAAAEWDLAVGIRRAFVDAWAAEEAVRIRREALALRERVLEWADERARGGAAPPAEGDLAAVDAGLAHGRLRTAEWESQEARRRLNRLLGLPPEARWGLQPPGPDGAQDLPAEGLEEAALRRRWDLAVHRAAYAQAEKALALAVLGQYPRLRLGPAYGREEGESGWGLGVALELPAWNRNRGGIAEAEAERDRQGASYAARIAGLRAELASASAEWTFRRDMVLLVEAEVRPRAARSLARAQEALEAGKADFLSVSLAQDRVLEALEEDLGARAALRQARIRLEGAMGCPVEEAASQGGGR